MTHEGKRSLDRQVDRRGRRVQEPSDPCTAFTGGYPALVAQRQRDFGRFGASPRSHTRRQRAASGPPWTATPSGARWDVHQSVVASVARRVSASSNRAFIVRALSPSCGKIGSPMRTSTLPAAQPLRSARQEVLRPGDPHRDERPLRLRRDERGARLELLEPAVGGASALGEEDQVPAFLHEPDGEPRGRRARALALDRERAEREGSDVAAHLAGEEVVGGRADERACAGSAGGALRGARRCRGARRGWTRRRSAGRGGGGAHVRGRSATRRSGTPASGRTPAGGRASCSRTACAPSPSRTRPSVRSGGTGAERGSADGRPQRQPARDLLDLVEQRHGVTSGRKSGGQCRCVMDGRRPTVSDAISSASRIVDAVRKPSRRTTSGSPPRKITSPR